MFLVEAKGHLTSQERKLGQIQYLVRTVGVPHYVQ